MTDVTAMIDGLAQVKEAIVRALRVTEADTDASPVLVAVLGEFNAKAEKATGEVTDASALREAVVELEQAGDSAKAAAEADPGIGSSTRDAVLDAHLVICQLKAR